MSPCGKDFFLEANVSWAAPASCRALLCERFNLFGGKKKGLALGGCAMTAIFWVVWVERNKRIYEGARGEEVDHLWDRVRYWLHFGHPFLLSSLIILYMLYCWIRKLL